MPAPRRPWTVPVFVALAAGCSSTPDARPVRVTPGSTYRSPAGNFAVVVPALMGPGVRQTEAVADDRSTAAVTFADDFGTYLDVQSRRLPVEGLLPDFASQVRPGDLDRFVDARVVPTLGPSATVVRREHVPVAGGDAVFLVVRRPDAAVGGVAVFPRLRWVYAVTVRQVPPTPNQPPLAAGDRDARLLSDLRQAVGQMTFD